MPTNMRAAVAVLVLLSAMVPAWAQKPDAPGDEFLRDLRTNTAFALEEAAVTLDGVLGCAIVDLASGDTFGRMSSVPFPTASTIKLAILYEFSKRADEGTLSPSTSYLQDESAAHSAIERPATAACNYSARVGGAAPETGRQLYR